MVLFPKWDESNPDLMWALQGGINNFGGKLMPASGLLLLRKPTWLPEEAETSKYATSLRKLPGNRLINW